MMQGVIRGRGRGRGVASGMGAGMRAYHVPPSEMGTGGGSTDLGSDADQKGLPQENALLKNRVNQLERLLADACYCMTLAVGDQNPAISSLMKTISELAPESALANQVAAGNTADNPSNEG